MAHATLQAWQTERTTPALLSDPNSRELGRASTSGRCQSCSRSYRSPKQFRMPLQPRGKPVVRARKRSEDLTEAGEWAALAYEPREREDPAVLQSVTEVCNKGLRLMLRGETMRLEPFKDELSKWGQHFADKGNMQGAIFIYAVYQLADHMLPKQVEQLQDEWLDAYTKIFDILEDSGWRIRREGEEEDDDDKDLLPDQSAGYFQNAGL